MSLTLSICFEGDHIGRYVDRAALADDMAEVRKITTRVEQGNDQFRAWAEENGGEMIVVSGYTGRFNIPADKIADLPDVCERYKAAVGTTCSVGIGIKLHEAERALMAAKAAGGDRTIFYGDEAERIIHENEGKEPQAELGQQIRPDVEGELQKAAPPAPATPPVEPKAEGSEHSQGETARETFEASRPGPPEAPKSTEDELHEHATRQEQADQQGAAQSYQHLDELRAKVAQVLGALKAQMPVMEALKQQAPEAYQSVVGLAQAVIEMARELPKPEEVKKAEDPTKVQKVRTFLDKGKFPPRMTDAQLYNYFYATHMGGRQDVNKLPWGVDEWQLMDVPINKLQTGAIPTDTKVQEYAKRTTPMPPIIATKQGIIEGMHRTAAAGVRKDPTIRAYVPRGEAEYFRDVNKDEQFTEGNWPNKIDENDAFRYMSLYHMGSRADLHKIPYDVNYELVTVPLAGLTSGVLPTSPRARQYAELPTDFPPILLKSEGAIIDGHHRTTAAKIRGDATIRAYVPIKKEEETDNTDWFKELEELARTLKIEADPANAVGTGGELEKRGMPVGTEHNGKATFSHADGTTGTVQYRSGKVLNQNDPSYHVSSALHPNRT